MLTIYIIPVVDVVRTDSHLEFFEDTKNLARMSDILAVYAWVDPATGYCQGCSPSFSFLIFFSIRNNRFSSIRKSTEQGAL